MKEHFLVVIMVLLAVGCAKKEREQYPVVPNQMYPQAPVMQPQVPKQQDRVIPVTTEEGMRIILLDTPNPSNELLRQAAMGVQSKMAEELNIGMCVSPEPLTIQTGKGLRSGYGIGPCDIFGERAVGQVAHGEGERTKGR